MVYDLSTYETCIASIPNPSIAQRITFLYHRYDDRKVKALGHCDLIITNILFINISSVMLELIFLINQVHSSIHRLSSS